MPNDAPAPADILVVDDTEANRVAFEATLRPLGENVILASSGEEALQLALAHTFAVILLDVRMPGMNGYETAELLRLNDRSRATPIIFVSAFPNTPVEVTRGYVAGAIDYIPSPVDEEVLKFKVAAFVDLYRKNQALRRLADELEEANKALQEEVDASRSAEARLRQRASELGLAVRRLEDELARFSLKPREHKRPA